MKGVQPPVEPPPAGRFAFFLHLLRTILTLIFSGFFLLFKQPKNSKNKNELFGCLKERKKSQEKN